MSKIKGYITAKEYAEKLNVSTRRVNQFISSNRINGAVKIGNTWMIPERTEDVRDTRYIK